MSTSSDIIMGKLAPAWKGGMAKSITFSVTEECNLACKYCYMTGKNSRKKMSFEIARKAIDYILANRELFNEESVVWDFVDGEPFLEIDLIDRICDYIKQQLYILDHPWFNSYRFSFSTNGLLYGTPKVQRYIAKNKNHLSIGISVDGNKIKHDLQRIKPDGSGSYDDVLKNVPLWIEQFPNAGTKSTFAHDDLPYLKDSIISLWNIGIKMVSANVIFENEWHEGDDQIFENQLKELADYILGNHLWDKYSVRFFSPHIGFPLTEEDLKRNYCGAGKMLAIDCDGNFFPCLRFLDFTLNNRKGLCIGDINSGINTDKIRPFHALTLESQSTEECLKCEVASGCSWCTGFNYDAADTDTIYQRATFICKMHKANVRANEYFWNKFSEVTGLTSSREEYRRQRYNIQYDKNSGKNIPKHMFFITFDHITPHCSYKNWNNTSNVMSREVLDKGLKFAEENNFIPVFLGNIKLDYQKALYISDNKSNNLKVNSVIVYNNNIENYSDIKNHVCILLISKNNLRDLSNFVKNLYTSTNRVNIVLEDIEKWDDKDIRTYSNQLDELVDIIVETYETENTLDINVLTDVLNLKTMCNCDAGNSTFALAPNGKFYICPAFYFDNPDNDIGDINKGIDIKNDQLLSIENAPICSECNSYHCRRCKFLNEKLTNEINIPSRVQCIIAHIEREKSLNLQNRLIDKGCDSGINMLQVINYIDPLEKILNKAKRSVVNA